MSAAAREILRSLLAAYVENVRPEIAAARWKRIESAGRRGPCGSRGPAVPRPAAATTTASRVPTFVAEYDNTQNGANHVHSVWHDLESGTAADLLRRHYAEDPHHEAALR